MRSPAEDVRRFLIACALGLGLGLCYDFLRPLRKRHQAPADGVFLLLTGWSWLYLGFAVCQGDLRIGYTAGLLVGGLLWEWTLGRVFRPIFGWFFQRLEAILGFFARPVKKFSKKSEKK